MMKRKRALRKIGKVAEAVLRNSWPEANIVILLQAIRKIKRLSK